jgi:hypothetical protein
VTNRDSQSTSERVSFLDWSSRSGETIFLFLASLVGPVQENIFLLACHGYKDSLSL